MRTKLRTLRALSIIRILIAVRNYFKKMRTKYALNMVRSKFMRTYNNSSHLRTYLTRTNYTNFRRIILNICALILCALILRTLT